MTPALLAAAAPVPPALLDQVRGRAPGYFPELGAIRELHVAARRRRPYSEVLRVRVTDERARSREVVLKVTVAAERQFLAMRRAWPRFAEEPTLSMPRPLDYLPDGPAVVMESVPGSPLSARLLPLVLGGRLRSAEACSSQAGRWLRLYHEAARGGEPRPLDAAAKWDFLLESAAALRRAGVDGRLLEELVARLRPIADDAGERPRPLAHVHGEFTADNVLVDGGRMAGIDVWGTFLDTVDHDVASFLNSLELVQMTCPVPGSSIARLERAFLLGYASGPTEQSSATLLLRAIGLADVGLEILTRRTGRLARAWVRRRLGRSLAAGLRAAGRWEASRGRA